MEMMKNKIVLTLIAALCGMSSVAHAESAGNGIVNFSGSVVDAPCSINPTDSSQTVDLGQLSNAVLNGGGDSQGAGQSKPVMFDITLEDCALTTLNNVKVMFNATTKNDDKKLIVNNGDANGTFVRIRQGDTLLNMGTATSNIGLMNGSNQLAFSADVVGDGKTQVTPGSIRASATFELSYN